METLKLLAINASFRKNGNSTTFLEDTLKVLEEVNFPVAVTQYQFAGKRFGPCTGCLACYKNGGNCVVQDDFQQLRQLWIDADIVLYAFPIYSLGFPGQLKCFLDRLGNSLLGYYDSPGIRHMKVIAALPQGGVSMGGQELCNQAIMEHAALLNCIYVSGDTTHVGSGAISGVGGNRHSLREKGAAHDPVYDESVSTACNMLKRMVEMGAILKEGTLNLKEILSQDVQYLPPIRRFEQNK